MSLLLLLNSGAGGFTGGGQNTTIRAAKIKSSVIRQATVRGTSIRQVTIRGTRQAEVR